MGISALESKQATLQGELSRTSETHSETVKTHEEVLLRLKNELTAAEHQQEDLKQSLVMKEEILKQTQGQLKSLEEKQHEANNTIEKNFARTFMRNAKGIS